MIKKEDFYKKGTETFYPVVYDKAIIYPVAEMAGWHVRYIPEVQLMYTDRKSNSDSTTSEQLSFQVEAEIMSKSKYKNLKCLYFKNENECMTPKDYLLNLEAQRTWSTNNDDMFVCKILIIEFKISKFREFVHQKWSKICK